MKKSCRRKERPLASPVSVALRRAAPLPHDLIDQMRLRELSTIEAFDKGNGNVDDFKLLQELQRMCLCSISLGIGPEAMETCDAASTLLNDICMLFTVEKSVIRLDSVQIQILRDLQAFHDLQRAAVSRGEYSRIADMAQALSAND